MFQMLWLLFEIIQFIHLDKHLDIGYTSFGKSPLKTIVECGVPQKKAFDPRKIKFYAGSD